jgi:hypothetical protein
MSDDSGGVTDSYSETSSQSWFGRIGDSLKAMLFGFLLFGASFVLIFWNEGRAIHRAQDLDEGAKSSIVIKSDAVDPANQEKLVFLAGFADTKDVITDPEFKVEPAKALILQRHAEMYQWDEDEKHETKEKLGGGTETVTTYTYHKKWYASRINSGSFKKPAGHANPDSMPYSSWKGVAPNIEVGAFKLPDAMVGMINNFESLPLVEADLQKANAATSKTFVISDNKFYQSATPGSPAIGDVRIYYDLAKPTDVSLLGRQQDNTFGAFQTTAGRDLMELRVGSMSKEAFFLKLVSENNMLTWILRGVGWLIMFMGLQILAKPLQVLASVVPFFGTLVGYAATFFAFMISAVLTLITIGIGWIAYRPMLGGMIIGCGVVVLILYCMMRGHKATIHESDAAFADVNS